MNTFLVLLCVLAGFSPSFVLSQPPNTAPPYALPPNTTPYFKLVLQWGYSLCNSGTPCSPPNPYASVPPPQYRFTIHGLWPDYHPRRVKTAPANCRSIPYTTIHEKNQLAKMEYFWPNVETKGANVRFWTQQWLKHGTCAEPQLTQEQFFNKALDLVNRLNLDHILLAGGSGLKIGLNYANGPNYANVTRLIQQSLGVLPEVECNTNTNTRQKQIKEIRVCYDHPHNSWINCPTAFNSCPYPYELPLLFLLQDSLNLQLIEQYLSVRSFTQAVSITILDFLDPDY